MRQFIEWVESREKSPRDLLDLCLQRIAQADPAVRAWVQVAPREPASPGRLRGIPFGVKDIIETRGMSTAFGSPLYAGRQGECDAAVVEELLGAGALLLGKTQTTAFASFDPAPTLNPRLAGHTPGGSSSGSAAAVAAGMVPFAVGTQTLGSVVRPASYCGVCGFKPSFGLIPTRGVLPFAPSLDTVGFFTQTAADMECLWRRGFGGAFQAELRRAVYFRLGVSEPLRPVEDAVEHLQAAGIPIDTADPPAGWDRLVEAARAINDYEGARTHSPRLDEFGDRIGARLAVLIRRGLQIPEADYLAARAFVSHMRGELARILWDYPAILTPATNGPAPVGFDSTGDPAFNAPWTALGMPAITVPLPASPAPLGLQITAAWGRDDALVSVATHTELLLN